MNLLTLLAPLVRYPQLDTGVPLSDDIKLAKLIARRFICRTDVKAYQFSGSTDGYAPELERKDGPRVPWSAQDVLDHLSGKKSYGHYLLDSDSNCKLFAFDIDLRDRGWLPKEPILDVALRDEEPNASLFVECDPRASWQSHKSFGRSWSKLQMHLLGQMFARAISEELEIPTAVAYSGAKGIHVYGFTGKMPAADARQGALMVLDHLKDFKPEKGKVFYKHTNDDPLDGYPNFSIEVFPKQDSLAGKDLGNLMRLPLGKNLKAPRDPTFFVDLTAALASLTPADPLWALGQGASTPWRRQGE